LLSSHINIYQAQNQFAWRVKPSLFIDFSANFLLVLKITSVSLERKWNRLGNYEVFSGEKEEQGFNAGAKLV